jgi:hypothetical protein
MLFSAGATAQVSREITIHKTAGISWDANLWVELYCPKGYNAIRGGHGPVPAGLRILSSGPERVNYGTHHIVIWAIHVDNPLPAPHWLELKAWATCSTG